MTEPEEHEIVDQPAVAGDPLAALEAQAAYLEAAAAPGALPGAAPAMSAADELLSTLQMVRMMAAPVCTWWPEFGTVWSDQAIAQIAASGGAIMDKHGWTMGETMSTYGPYIALIGATLPPAAATYLAIQQHRADLAAEARDRA